MKNKKYEIFWSSWAKFDIKDILSYYSDNPKYAIKIIDKIDKAVNKISFFPEKNRKIHELVNTSFYYYREIITNPYRIFFKIGEDIIYIIGVIDGKRNIEDILIKRLMKS